MDWPARNAWSKYRQPMDITPFLWAALVYAGLGIFSIPNSNPLARQSLVAGSYRAGGVYAVAAPCHGQ